MVAETARQEVLRKLWNGVDPLAGFAKRLYAVDKQGWNSDHPYLTESIEALRPRVVVEIGVWKGGSTMTMAQRLKDMGLDAVVVAVDTWLGSSEHWVTQASLESLNMVDGYPSLIRTFMSNIVNSDLQDYVVQLPLDSLNAGAIVEHWGIVPDVIHLDGSHDYPAVMQDLARWWPLLRKGGYFIGDDYFVTGEWPGVRQAFDEFFREKGLFPFEFTGHKCRIRKPV